jgi:CrcB protein
MIKEILFVGCGGALGSVARFTTVIFSQSWVETRFPLGNMLVNIVGSYLIGILMPFFFVRHPQIAEYWKFFLVVGFLGGFTTFSSFSWETFFLLKNSYYVLAIANIFLSLLLGLLATLAGFFTYQLLGFLPE